MKLKNKSLIPSIAKLNWFKRYCIAPIFLPQCYNKFLRWQANQCVNWAKRSKHRMTSYVHRVQKCWTKSTRWARIIQANDQERTHRSPIDSGFSFLEWAGCALGGGACTVIGSIHSPFSLPSMLGSIAVCLERLEHNI